MVPERRPARTAFGPVVAVLAIVGGLVVVPRAPARAEILSAKVVVRGMTCNICSGTVERRLKRVACIVTASVDLERGLASIGPRGGQRFDGRRVLKAIRDAGFTPGDIRVVARGRLISREGAAYLELGAGELAILTGPSGRSAPPGLPAPGSRVQVSGRFADPSGDPRASVAIAVERAELASTE